MVLAIDRHRMDVAVGAVQDELLPGFRDHPGVRHGFWMADRASGQILVVTLWRDHASLEAARGADGAERSAVADRIGLRIHAIQSMEVVGHHRDDHEDRPVFRAVRATWVSSLRSHTDERLLPLFDQTVPDQARSEGFRGSYWLADGATGTGLALSFWDGVDALVVGSGASRRRRRRLQQQLGFAVESVHEYESLGVVLSGSAVGTTPAVERTVGAPT